MSLSDEIQTRQAQRDILAAFLRAHPLQVCGPDELEAVIGPNYRSRISDCRDELGMHIPNVPRYREYQDEQGKTRRQRLCGGYQYFPQAPQGRDASQPAADRWPVFGAPYVEPFKLTPPEAQ